MTTYNDIAVYVSKPAAYPHEPAKLLLLLTSGTGVNSVNNQLQADAFAAQGFVVVMPDQCVRPDSPFNIPTDIPGSPATLPPPPTPPPTSPRTSPNRPSSSR